MGLLRLEGLFRASDGCFIRGEGLKHFLALCEDSPSGFDWKKHSI